MKRGKFMICKNCSANIDDNVAYCPYCGAPNDAQGSQQNAQGYQQSQNEYTTKMSSRAVNIFITVSKIININSRIRIIILSR